MDKKKQRKMIVDRYPGNGYISHAEMCRLVSKRTGLENNTIRYILDSYKDVVEEEMTTGKKVDIVGLGYIVYKLRKGFYSPMLQMTIPNRFFPDFVFRTDLRKRVGKLLTEDVIKED